MNRDLVTSEKGSLNEHTLPTSKEAFDLASCPMVSTVELIGGKWKLGIICYLRQGTWRFKELQRHLPKVKHQVLSQQLRELEEANIVRRKVYAEVPPKVEYSLTETGQSLLPVLNALHAWGREHFADCCARPMKEGAKRERARKKAQPAEA